MYVLYALSLSCIFLATEIPSSLRELGFVRGTKVDAGTDANDCFTLSARTFVRYVRVSFFLIGLSISGKLSVGDTSFSTAGFSNPYLS